MIFVSYGSEDREFARNLAFDLASQGMPVWFDEWRLRPGATLAERIDEGVLESAVVLVVLSRSAVEDSRWRTQEVRVALEKQAGTDADAVIPLILGEAKVPDALAGLLYVDFSRSYSAGLERLVDTLRGAFAPALTYRPDEVAAVPLQLDDGYELSIVKLSGLLATLSLQARDQQFEPDQLVLSEDHVYSDLREGLLRRVDDRNIPPAEREKFREAYENLRRWERELARQVAQILSTFAQPTHIHRATACYWLVYFVRSDAFTFLKNLVHGDDIEAKVSDRSRPFHPNHLFGRDAETNVFGKPAIVVDVFLPDESASYAISVPVDTLLVREISDASLTDDPRYPAVQLRAALRDVAISTELEQFVVPQIAYQHVVRWDKDPLVVWPRFDELMVGPR